MAFMRGFFQCFWLLVGDTVREEVKGIFASGRIPDYLNQTIITIIPKCQNPETFNHYYPISLCNTVYKIVTKIIVARLRSLLPGLVSPLQTAFVLGRKGIDNAIIVQEIIHSMSRKRGRGESMAIKIDLEKAYDRLEWSFIRDTLTLFKIPNQLITLIMSYISSSSISILFNEGALESFHPSRGIRQGDPLSPYLFILCMKVLGAFIADKCNSNLWNPIKASWNGPAFSHLFFADDLVLFTRADRKNCVAIREVLHSFCSISGEKISHEKSRVFFSPNVSFEARADLCDILGFRSTPSLRKYLGIPIKQPTVPQDFRFIIERVQSRLAGWKANLLSFTGRLVLTQAVITTILNYAIQCVALLAKVLNSVDRLSRNFLWGSLEGKKRLHLVSWKKITKPKKDGGLGIQATKAKNVANLAKLNWRLHTKSSSPWARVLSQKYCYPRRVSNARFKPCSATWSVIRKGESVFNKGAKWVVGKDSKLSFWFDKWLDRGLL